MDIDTHATRHTGYKILLYMVTLFVLYQSIRLSIAIFIDLTFEVKIVYEFFMYHIENESPI